MSWSVVASVTSFWTSALTAAADRYLPVRTCARHARECDRSEQEHGFHTALHRVARRPPAIPNEGYRPAVLPAAYELARRLVAALARIRAGRRGVPVPAMSTQVWQRPFGAVPLSGGGVEFRVWAPAVARVAVRVRGGEHELAPIGEGVFAAEVAARAG